MKSLQQIKDEIVDLSAKFHLINENDLDSLKKVELIEMEIFELIIDFAFEQNIIKEKNDIEFNQRIINRLSVENEVVFNLNWFYTKLFYPDFYENKEEFLEMIKLDFI
jgi:hypothetical protein